MLLAVSWLVLVYNIFMYLHLKNIDNVEFLYLGVIHTFGFTPYTKELLLKLENFKPDVILLHMAGTLDSVQYYLKNTPSNLWEETYFFAEYGIKNNIPLLLGDPNFLKNLSKELMSLTTLEDAPVVHDLRELCLNIWLSKKHMIDYDKVPNIDQIRSYVSKHFSLSLEDFINTEILNFKGQPEIFAPYPINKTDIGIFNKYRSDRINEHEINRILEVVSSYKRVFSETGRFHFINQKEVLLSKLGSNWVSVSL